VAAALVVACSESDAPPRVHEAPAPTAAPSEQVGAPNARPDLAEQMAADLSASRDPSDGGGRVWLVGDPDPSLRAGGFGRLEFIYEAGPLGIAPGGSVTFQPPLWGWTSPGTSDRPGGLGAWATALAEGLELEVDAPDAGILRITISGRAMDAGEQLRILYGEGKWPIVVGRYAQRRARFNFWVDGDGDSVRSLVAGPPSVDVAPGPAQRLVAHLPATLRPGEPAMLRIAVLDRVGSAGVEIEGHIEIDLPDSVAGPRTVELTREASGVVAVEVVPAEEGILEVGVRAPGGLETRTPPSLVSATADRVLWVDLHGHTQLSDGTGTPEDFLRYAREVAALDAVALTDHDHWGIPFLDQAEENWDEIRTAVERHHEPGTFVALLGYEWTNWVYGHRHVLHFGADGPLFSWVDPRTDTPTELWDALRGLPALTFAHHSAGQPVATDWRIPPDPQLEPVTEIVSVHGSSEAFDTPSPVRGGIEGNFVRDALERGYRLGFVGSGDSHDGHPGLAQLASPSSGGLAAVLAPERTRGALLASLQARRSYATNGPRILLDVRLDGHVMGAELAKRGGSLEVQVASPGELAAIELVADGDVVERAVVEGRSASLRFSLPKDSPERWLYVRVLQEDGGAAWSSPYFFPED
jgi:hypothetical protein